MNELFDTKLRLDSSMKNTKKHADFSTFREI
jgi:hypothetical protein